MNINDQVLDLKYLNKYNPKVLNFSLKAKIEELDIDSQI